MGEFACMFSGIYETKYYKYTHKKYTYICTKNIYVGTVYIIQRIYMYHVRDIKGSIYGTRYHYNITSIYSTTICTKKLNKKAPCGSKCKTCITFVC